MFKPTVVKQSVGIDVAKDSFSVCFAQDQVDRKFRILSTRTFAYTPSGFALFDAWIQQHWDTVSPLHVLMEATGVYYEQLAYFLHHKAYRVSVVLPNKAKAYARTLNCKSKTDDLDAKVLTQMSLNHELAQWIPPGKKMLTIKRLCRERVELLEQKTAATNRLHAKEHAHQPECSSRSRAQKLIAFLQKQIAQVEAAIKQTVGEDAEIAAKIQLICSIKGVAIITAATIIGETDGFALIQNKAQLVSYAGYDVVQQDSGTSLHAKGQISKKGNRHIRRALHFPALVALKHTPQLQELYQRVYDRTRIKMKGAVAVQRKLLVLIYTLYRKNESYDPIYAQKPFDYSIQQNRQKQQSVPA